VAREIGYGYDSDVLRTLLGTSEAAPFDVEEALRGVVVLQSDRPEWGFLRNEFLFISRALSRGAIAGRFGHTGIVNRSPRNLVVITGFQNLAGAANISFARGRLPDAPFEASLVSDVPAIPIDIRVPGTPDASLAAREVTGDSVAGVGSTPFGLVVGAADYPRGMLPVLAILAPNSYVVGQGTVVNTAVNGIWFGYQKTLFKADRA
jgi:hypothetical protein